MNRFLKSLVRPHYLYRPSQVTRRVYRQFVAGAKASTVVALPWGARMRVDPREHIGRSIYLHGIYDLGVSEALWRLLQAGDVAVDAGAHVGYMTGLMAARVGAPGRVLAFEPHPQLFRELRQNAKQAEQAAGGSPVTLFELALSCRSGPAVLRPSADFGANRGTARLVSSGEAASEEVPTDVRVSADTLDGVLERCLSKAGRVAVLKVDVEGHEAAVLDGAARLLGEGRIAHVVYEQHGGWDGPAHGRLAQRGYALYGLNWKHAGPQLIPKDQPLRLRPGETPNFVATRRPGETERRFAPRGWRCLRP